MPTQEQLDQALQYWQRVLRVRDWESTLVHELLHIVLERWRPEEDREDDLEVAINQLADALITLKRKHS
jgi:predicted metal-dependent peptidase